MNSPADLLAKMEKSTTFTPTSQYVPIILLITKFVFHFRFRLFIFRACECVMWMVFDNSDSHRDRHRTVCMGTPTLHSIARHCEIMNLRNAFSLYFSDVLFEDISNELCSLSGEFRYMRVQNVWYAICITVKIDVDCCMHTACLFIIFIWYFAVVGVTESVHGFTIILVNPLQIVANAID